eukprot:Rhum_TRINITY_DN14594_c17_g1::Rhum_TRINITY_DN14594_c17_g1_i1::g.101513::m.101513/K03165/TOP3; DNA topoisomerase III
MPVRPGSAESPASMLSSPSGDSGAELPLQPITRQDDPRAEYACLFGKGQQIYHIAKVTKIGRNNSAKERAVVLLEERLAQVEVTEVPKTTTHRAQMKRYTRYARIEQLTYQSLVRSNSAARVDRVLLSIPSEYDMVFEFSDDHGPGANTTRESRFGHASIFIEKLDTIRKATGGKWRVVTAKANDDLTKRAKLAAPGFVKPGNTIAVKEKTFVPSIKRVTPKQKKLIRPSSSPQSSQQIVVTPAPAGVTPVTEAHDIQHQTGPIGARGVLSCHCGKTNLESDPAGYYKCVTCPEASDVVCYACYSEVQHAIESPTRAPAAAPADTASSSQPARPMSQTQVFSAAEEAPHAVGGVAGSQATTSFNTLGDKPAGRTPGDRDTLRFAGGAASMDPLGAPAAAAPETDDVAVLYTAMKGLGTDEDAIYGAMERVRSQAEWEQKRSDFRQRYPQFHDGDLVAAMRSDLTQKEFARCESTLQNKGVVLDPFPQVSSAGPPAVGGAGGRGSRGSSPLADTTQPHPYPAQPTSVVVDDTEALRKALTGESTDAAVVWGVLGGVQSQGAWIAAQDAYKKRYGADLVHDMRAELTGRELQRCEEILKRRGILVHDDVASSLSSSAHDSSAGASPAKASPQRDALQQQQQQQHRPQQPARQNPSAQQQQSRRQQNQPQAQQPRQQPQQQPAQQPQQQQQPQDDGSPANSPKQRGETRQAEPVRFVPPTQPLRQAPPYATPQTVVESVLPDPALQQGFAAASKRLNRGLAYDAPSLAKLCDGFHLMSKLKDGTWQEEAGVSAEFAAHLDESGMRDQVVDARTMLVKSATPPPHVKRALQGNRKVYHELLSLYPDADQSRPSFGGDGTPSVLMVAEKPSVAQSIAEALSGGRKRTRKGIGRGLMVHEFFATFPPTGRRCAFKVTSVVGHIFGLTFDESQRVDELNLFGAKTIKKVEDTSEKCRVVDHIKNEAEGCENLVLWLDCDREGENIGYEVISITRDAFPDDSAIFRAHFSSITAAALGDSFRNLIRPNVNLSMAVDARQELDLKIGVAFTRYLTKTFRSKAQQRFQDADIKTISYGPCQSPCLYFCVRRHLEIMQFRPEQYFEITLQLATRSGERFDASWERGRVPDRAAAESTLRAAQAAGGAACAGVDSRPGTLRSPVALNTVALLKSASSGLGLSPHKAMKVAEKLYTGGYISYPRTESTRYHPSFQINPILSSHANHPNWGQTAAVLLRQHNGAVPLPQEGKDAGDHPPITPTGYATRNELQGVEWRLYELVVRCFLGSLMPPAQYDALTYRFVVGGEAFSARRWAVRERGFLYSMPWMNKHIHPSLAGDRSLEQPLQQCPQGAAVSIVGSDLSSDWTRPPTYLSESSLVSEMDKNGVGTDASIPQHVQNVCDRKYVVVCGDSYGHGRAFGRQIDYKRIKEPEGGEGRFMVPTTLGVCFMLAFMDVDLELVKPTIRAHIESEVKKIADGVLLKNNVVEPNLDTFRSKFVDFRRSAARVSQFFDPQSEWHEPGPAHRYAREFLDKYYEEQRVKRDEAREKAASKGGKGGKGGGGGYRGGGGG